MSEFKLPKVDVGATVTTTNEIPWGVQMVNAPTVWNETKGENIVVCILDTGIKKDHPDLKDRIITGLKGGQNFTADYQYEPYMIDDNHGHGTHVAGTIAATLNGVGVVGVAPNVKLLIGKVLNGDGGGTFANIAKAIRWAADWTGDNGEKVRVISMSLGGPSDVQELHDAVKYATSKNVVIVCAAGNEGDGSTSTNEFDYPGAYPEVIQVGAIDNQKKLASFSNTNAEIDVVAPGVNILSTTMDGMYGYMSGTSMATPHIAGVVTLLISMYEKRLNKTLSVADVRQLLKEHSRDIGIDPKGEGFGLSDLSIGYEQPFEKVIELYIDKSEALVNGVPYKLDAATEIKNNITMVPLRFIAENLDCKVDWDNDLRKVTITK